MKLQIENLGAIRYAEMNLSNLTVICGMNNQGKTYATYAIYGFLYFWQKVFQIQIDNSIILKLKDTGVCTISAKEYVTISAQIIQQACEEYTSQLASVFSSMKNRFENASFKINMVSEDVKIMDKKFSGGISSANTKTRLTVSKEEKSEEITVTLFSEDNKAGEVPDFIIADSISHWIKTIVFSSVFPNVFIASAERTGAAIFRRELNFARNKMLDEIVKKDAEIDQFFLLKNGKSDYAWPVNHNVEFLRNLSLISKSESEIYGKHKNVIDSFSDIIGGDFQITDDDIIYFIPNKSKLRLSVDESSSSVRALLDVGFYLKHEAQLGDLLIIDEPELNLHPNNQRKIARLLASLVNCGIKVFVTTHSDYILREWSNLILLNGNSPHLAEIIERENYAETELIQASDISIYTAENSLVTPPGYQRKVNVGTLVQVPVDDENGINGSSFDDVINEMNRLTDDIVFGG